MKRRTLLGSGSAALALGGAWMLTQNGQQPAGSNILVGMAHAQDAEPMAIEDMVLGSADAPVEVIEYASYTCPHCASFHASTFKQLKEDYIDTGKIRFVYREVYFDRFGLWASMVARCGNGARFFEISDMIYAKQREWTASGDPATISQELQKMGKIAGLDQAMLDECMSDGAFAQSLVGWYQANAERDGVNSTPSFLIEGVKYSNMAYSAFAEILDEALAG